MSMPCGCGGTAKKTQAAQQSKAKTAGAPPIGRVFKRAKQ